MYYILSSIIVPQNACIHSVLVMSTFIFEEKSLFVSLTSKLHSFHLQTDASHLCKLIARNSRPPYLKPMVPISVLAKLFKNILFSTQGKCGDDFLHFKSVSVRQKTVAFSSLQFYIAKLIAGLVGFSCIMCPWYTNFKDVPDVT